jgi:hypothetical protein
VSTRLFGEQWRIRQALRDQHYPFDELRFSKGGKEVTLWKDGKSFVLIVKKRSNGYYEFGQRMGNRKFKPTRSKAV